MRRAAVGSDQRISRQLQQSSARLRQRKKNEQFRLTVKLSSEFSD